jgi:hypothetical protein
VLCVAVAAVAVFWANGAWASATLSPELRERYIFYPLPIVLALLPAAVERLRPRTIALVTAVAALYLAPVLPGLYGSNGEEFVQYRIDQVTKRLGLGTDVPLGSLNLWAVALVVLGAALLLALRWRRRISPWLFAAAVVVPTLCFQLGVLTVRERDANGASAAFAAQYPEPADFVDTRVHGPAAFVRTPGTPPLARVYLELENEQLQRTWRTPGTDEFNGLGADCPLATGPGGGLVPDPAWAGAAADPAAPCTGKGLARYLLFDDQLHTVEVTNGKLLFAEGPTRLYEIPPGAAPRIVFGAAPQL